MHTNYNYKKIYKIKGQACCFLKMFWWYTNFQIIVYCSIAFKLLLHPFSNFFVISIFVLWCLTLLHNCSRCNEMIIEAVSALKEPNGSDNRAIISYIEVVCNFLFVIISWMLIYISVEKRTCLVRRKHFCYFIQSKRIYGLVKWKTFLLLLPVYVRIGFEILSLIILVVELVFE